MNKVASATILWLIINRLAEFAFHSITIHLVGEYGRPFVPEFLSHGDDVSTSLHLQLPQEDAAATIHTTHLALNTEVTNVKPKPLHYAVGSSRKPLVMYYSCYSLPN